VLVSNVVEFQCGLLGQNPTSQFLVG